MSGGITRAGTVIRQSPAATVIVCGPLVTKADRQSQMKAEALAESVRSWKGVLAMSKDDSELEKGVLESVTRLAKAIASPKNPVVQGNYLVAPVWSTSISDASKVRSLLNEAGRKHLKLVLVLDEDQATAESIARFTPGIPVIVFRSLSPTPRAIKVGKTALVSPGTQGKTMLSLSAGPLGYEARSIDLGPQVADDSATMRIYKRYLKRVEGENLLDTLPRSPSEPFAGTARCISCHTQAGKVWSASAHSHALVTLQKQDHGRDPDCVSCHVVALAASGGFRSLSTTPQLASVGCESCHGPGKKHADTPAQVHLSKIGEKSCMQCHVPDHSPAFEFKKFWSTIAH